MTVLLERTEPDPQQRVADLERQLAERTAEQDQSEAEKAAISEILGVINSSPGDLTPVFETMLDKAMHLCGAAFGGLWTYDGLLLHPALLRGGSPELAEFYREPYRPPAGGWSERVVNGAPFVYVPDITKDEGYGVRPTATAVADLGGFRTNLLVPLSHDGAVKETLKKSRGCAPTG